MLRSMPEPVMGVLVRLLTKWGEGMVNNPHSFLVGIGAVQGLWVQEGEPWPADKARLRARDLECFTGN